MEGIPARRSRSSKGDQPMKKEDAGREKILERIRKCFALGKSSEPHEAAAAIRQAQKLMAAHSITQDDLIGIEVRNELVITPEPPKRTMPLYLVSMVSLCCRAFGCEAIFEGVICPNLTPRQAIRYFGNGTAPMLAKYAHEVMFTAMRRSWQQYALRNTLDIGPRDRGSYWIGWLYGVAQKIEDFGMTEEQRNVVKNKRDTFYDNLETNMKVSSPEIESRAARAGHIDSNTFNIHRPVDGHSEETPTLGLPSPSSL